MFGFASEISAHHVQNVSGTVKNAFLNLNVFGATLVFRSPTNTKRCIQFQRFFGGKHTNPARREFSEFSPTRTQHDVKENTTKIENIKKSLGKYSTVSSFSWSFASFSSGFECVRRKRRRLHWKINARGFFFFPALSEHFTLG